MDKVILKSRQVSREESPVVRRAQAMAGGAEASVRTVEENGVVRAIEVVCTCGDRVTIELTHKPAVAGSGPGGS